MNKSINTSFEAIQEKNLGYVAALAYSYSNLCIKADPCSLLSVELIEDGIPYTLESRAHVLIHDEEGNDDKIDLFPKNGNEDIPFIIEGVMSVHPEFKPSVEVLESDGEDSSGENDSAEDDPVLSEEDEVHFIRFTMPVVDDDRKKLLEDAVNLCYDEAKVKIDAVNTLYGERIELALVGETKKTSDMVKESLETVKNQYLEIIDGYKSDKLKEIEDAHQRWLSEQATSSSVDKKWGQTLRV